MGLGVNLIFLGENYVRCGGGQGLPHHHSLQAVDLIGKMNEVKGQMLIS